MWLYFLLCCSSPLTCPRMGITMNHSNMLETTTKQRGSWSSSLKVIVKHIWRYQKALHGFLVSIIFSFVSFFLMLHVVAPQKSAVRWTVQIFSGFRLGLFWCSNESWPHQIDFQASHFEVEETDRSHFRAPVLSLQKERRQGVSSKKCLSLVSWLYYLLISLWEKKHWRNFDVKPWSSFLILQLVSGHPEALCPEVAGRA